MPYASDLREALASLSAAKAPDGAYRALLSSLARVPLRRGETYRQRAAQALRTAERLEREYPSEFVQ